MLSCECDIDTDYGDWYYYPPDDFSTFSAKRRKRCCSCNSLIDIGATCVEFTRFRGFLSDIEENIYGDEVPLASWYMCEWCGEMYFNFYELGYCHSLGDSMRETLEEYHELTKQNGKGST